jgi:putative PIN family toxin of toxin-antitoxin system
MLLTIDTNVMYQALKSSKGASFEIMQLIRKRELQLALSVPVFKEYQDVLSRKKSLNDFDLKIGDINKFLRFIAYISKTFDIYFLLRPNLKDEKDNMLLELAVTSQSEYLITNNIKHFKNPELKFDQPEILTPGEFLKKWREINV